MRRFAKPLYGLTPVPRVRIPPSPPVLRNKPLNGLVTILTPSPVPCLESKVGNISWISGALLAAVGCIGARGRELFGRSTRTETENHPCPGGCRCRHGLTAGSRKIQPALLLSGFIGIRGFRNSFAPRLGATLAPSGRNTKLWQ